MEWSLLYINYFSFLILSDFGFMYSVNEGKLRGTSQEPGEGKIEKGGRKCEVMGEKWARKKKNEN